MQEKPGVAVIVGGPSGEAEVSRVTGAGVAQALRARFSRVRVLELGPEVAGLLSREQGEVVFPALHGPPGEDGTFQGLLEILELPYVGSGVTACAVAMDKFLAKLAFRRVGLPVPADRLLGEMVSEEELDRILDELGGSLVVKPAGQGSALGVSFVSTPEELSVALEACLGKGWPALVETRITGREVTCGVLEGIPGEVLPVCEISTPEGSWYDYQHRYTEGLSEHRIPAPLDEARTTQIQKIALTAHRVLGCRDLSRADFVVPDEGEPMLLEVNTLPGMTPTSLFPDEARALGMSFEDLVEHLVLRAWRRGARG